MSHATLNSPSRAVAPGEHKEGTITKMIEQYTSQVPSGTYLTLAVGSIGLAAALKLMGRDKDFVAETVVEGPGIGVGGEDIELPDRDAGGLLVRHGGCPLA